MKLYVHVYIGWKEKREKMLRYRYVDSYMQGDAKTDD